MGLQTFPDIVGKEMAGSLPGMAENNKHKKIVKVVDIIRVPISSKEKNARTQSENMAKERESKSLNDLEEMISYHEGAKQREENPIKSKKPKKRHKVLWTAGALVIVVAVSYLLFWILPKVNVHIVTKKYNWQTQSSIVVNKNISQIDLGGGQVPGEIINQQKTVVMQFTPTGKKNLEKKATGVFTIYNAFGSASQILVATTRLQAPSGKIYRLVDKVTVPGAKIVDGKISPSSIDVNVIADQAGPDYNSEAIDKLTIPGLKGTPKYDGFYAAAPKGAAGGFIGEGLYPTADDITKAKSQAQIGLTDALNSAFAVQIPDGFTYRPDSISATTTKLTVNTNTDANNQFSVVADGQVSVMSFREADILELLRQKAQKDTQMSDDYVIKDKNDKTITYGSPVTDWKLGKMTLPFDFSATYWIPIDTAKLAQSIAGESSTDLKSTILGMAGIDKLSIDFSPFWVNSAPKEVSKINITVE
jgi:hypothetical protein